MTARAVTRLPFAAPYLASAAIQRRSRASLLGGAQAGLATRPDAPHVPGRHRHPALQRLLVLALGATLQVAPAAHAQPADPDVADYINPDRPGIADGSNVVGAGRFQIETGLQQEYRRSDGVRAQRLFIPTLLRLGLNENLEARIEGNTYTRMTAYDPAQGNFRTEGSAPASIGLKYHFVDSGGLKQPSLGALVRVFPPSGSGSFRTSHATGDFRLAADWDFAPQWSLNPNVGVGMYEDEGQRLYTAGLLAVTLNYNPSKVLNFFVDTGIQAPETKRGKTSIIFDVGAAYVIGRNVQIDLSVGLGAAGATPPRLFLAAGISARF